MCNKTLSTGAGFEAGAEAAPKQDGSETGPRNIFILKKNTATVNMLMSIV